MIFMGKSGDAMSGYDFQLLSEGRFNSFHGHWTFFEPYLERDPLPGDLFTLRTSMSECAITYAITKVTRHP
jgi:hypothetical protein